MYGAHFAPFAVAAAALCGSTVEIVRPAREIEAPAAWSYKSSSTARERCQWDGVPGPQRSVHQPAVLSSEDPAQDKGSCLPLPSFAMGNATPEACAPATAGPGVRSGQCLMVRAWPAGATFAPVVPTMLTSEQEPAALESELGDDRVTRLSDTRKPASFPLAPPMPGRLNHPLAAGPESVLVSSVGSTFTEGSEPGRDVPAPPDADLATTTPDVVLVEAGRGEAVDHGTQPPRAGVTPGPWSVPATATGGVALPRPRLLPATPSRSC